MPLENNHNNSQMKWQETLDSWVHGQTVLSREPYVPLVKLRYPHMALQDIHMAATDPHHQWWLPPVEIVSRWLVRSTLIWRWNCGRSSSRPTFWPTPVGCRSKRIRTRHTQPTQPLGEFARVEKRTERVRPCEGRFATSVGTLYLLRDPEN